MPFLTINGTSYDVAEGEARKNRLLVEQRNRNLEGGLLVDRITEKRRIGPVTVTKAEASPFFFTSAESEAFQAVLVADADLTIGGDLVGGGTLTMRASDIGTQRISTDHAPGGLRVYEWVSFVLEEV